MLFQARRRVRWTSTLVLVAAGLALLTLATQRVEWIVLHQANAALDQDRLDAARVLLAIAQVFQFAASVGLVVSCCGLLASVACWVATYRLIQRGRRAEPNPADLLTGTAVLFGDLLELLNDAHESLRTRMEAVERAEAHQTALEALSVVAPEQVQAVRSQMFEQLTPEFAKSTRLWVVGIVIAVLLLVVSHYWK